MRYILRDTTLPHQVVLFNLNASTGIFVSCNCLLKKYRNTAAYLPMAQVTEMAETVRFYNDPTRHHEPFSKEDELKWQPVPQRIPLSKPVDLR